MDRPAYAKWLLQKRYEWARTDLESFKISDFARYLEVSQPSLSQWIRGDHPPSGENLEKIAKKLGSDIYLTLGELPPEYASKVQDMTSEQTRELLQQIKGLIDTLSK